jgi:ketosteroid isomerase-like protein
MNTVDPRLIALRFNEFINHHDVDGLAALMTEDHQFVDRAGATIRGKVAMTEAWRDFFKSFPDYKNTFERIELRDVLVVLHGYATWTKGGDPDHAIWTATIESDLIAKWCVYSAGASICTDK